jgi:hypothetical protein
MTAIYNASAVKMYNATSSLARFENPWGEVIT